MTNKQPKDPIERFSDLTDPMFLELISFSVEENMTSFKFSKGIETADESEYRITFEKIDLKRNKKGR